MPMFQDKPCPTSSHADVCVKVIFSNGKTDSMNLRETSPFIFEGNMVGDEDVGVVLIDSPYDQTRLVIIK